MNVKTPSIWVAVVHLFWVALLLPGCIKNGYPNLGGDASNACFNNLLSFPCPHSFFQSSSHPFSVCVGVFTYNGLLYLQLDQRQIFRGPEQEKQHNRLDKKHSDKHSM